MDHRRFNSWLLLDLLILELLIQNLFFDNVLLNNHFLVRFLCFRLNFSLNAIFFLDGLLRLLLRAVRSSIGFSQSSTIFLPSLDALLSPQTFFSHLLLVLLVVLIEVSRESGVGYFLLVIDYLIHRFVQLRLLSTPTLLSGLSFLPLLVVVMA